LGVAKSGRLALNKTQAGTRCHCQPTSSNRCVSLPKCLFATRRVRLMALNELLIQECEGVVGVPLAENPLVFGPWYNPDLIRSRRQGI